MLPKSKDDFPSNRVEKIEEKVTDTLFSIMIGLTVIGSGLMFYNLDQFTAKLKDNNKEYEFPHYKDLYISLICAIFISLGKIVIEKLSLPLCEYILAKKYKNPEDKQNYENGRIYVKKLATNVFKIIYFSVNSTFGYMILSQLDYFPTTLGGNGYMMKMFEAGYPNSYYHWKPDYFNVYYLSALGFCLSDLFWLIFIYELQTDFILMILHHFCTISLICFSYLTNYSHVGCLVIFLHDIVDIYVFFCRIIVNMDVRKGFVVFNGVILLTVFIYIRIYFFGTLIYTIYSGIVWEWQWPTTCLVGFLSFLFIMHINWVYLIFKKFFGALQGKYEDTANLKKINKEN